MSTPIKTIASLLLFLALVACGKAPTPSPSLSGVWQIIGNGEPEYLEIEDNGGTLIGFYKPADKLIYTMEGTRLGTKFDLHVSDDKTNGPETADKINFTGDIDSPSKVSGEMSTRGDSAKRLWRAQRNGDVGRDLTKAVKEMRNTNREVREKMIDIEKAK